MSAATTKHLKTAPSPKPEYFQFTNLGPLLFGLFICGLAAIVISLLIAIFGSELTRERLMFGWLFGFGVCFTICAGCLFWILLHHAVDAFWTVVVRRILEVAASSFSYIWIFFLPLLIFAPNLWHWMLTPSSEAAFIPFTWHGHQERIYWLSRSTWTIRTIVGLLFFALAAAYLRNKSVRQDRDGNPWYSLRLRNASFVLIPCFAILFTSNVIDWLMSLNPHWYSTMWGVYLFAGSAWSSMATLIIAVYFLQRWGFLKDIVSLEHYHIMGKLLFTFTVFWAYIGFAQYFLYWYGNVPEEVEYFRRRNTETWNILSTLLVICHFVIPFLCLLPRNGKRNPRFLARLCIYCLIIHCLDIYIIVIPASPVDAVGFTFGTFFYSALSLVAIASPLIFLFLRNLGKQSLYPVRDIHIIASLKLVN